MLLCVDIGGTAVKYGLCGRDGVIVRKGQAPVAEDAYRTPVLETALKAAKAFVGAEAVEGVAVSATGQIDTATGEVIGVVGSFPNYLGSQIGQAFREAFGVKATVLNDANAAALGEAWLGAARGVRDFVMVTLGTGVGGGVVTGGRLLEGARGIGGELGHFPLRLGGLPCPCGSSGCYERYASTTALVARAEAATGLHRNGLEIFRDAGAGDETLLRVLDAWLDDVAAGLRGLAHIFNPSLILIGGGVSAQKTLLMDPLRAKVLSGIMPRFSEYLRIEPAALGNDAGLLGALKFFLDSPS